VLTPSLELFKSLESCCKDLVEWPPLRPVFPGRDVDQEKYTQLLDAVNLLRDVPKYRPTPAGWQSLKPILVERFEEVGGRFETAENESATGELHLTKSAAEGRGNASDVSTEQASSDTVPSAETSASTDMQNTVGEKVGIVFSLSCSALFYLFYVFWCFIFSIIYAAI